MQTMRLKLLGATVLSLGLLGAACANTSPGGGPGDGSTGGSTGTGGIPHPTGADQVVLRIESGGGFIPIEYSLTSMPIVSLFGDGLAITPGAQIEIYPGPALPASDQARLSADAIQLLLQAAIDVGLDTDRTYTDMGSVAIADAATTTFTLVVDGQTHTTAVYALGELGPKPETMSADEYQARKDLLAFETKATDLSWLPDGSVTDQGTYRPSGVRVFSGEYRPEARREGRQGRGRDGRGGQPADPLDERRRPVRIALPTTAAGRVRLLKDRVGGHSRLTHTGPIPVAELPSRR